MDTSVFFNARQSNSSNEINFSMALASYIFTSIIALGRDLSFSIVDSSMCVAKICCLLPLNLKAAQRLSLPLHIKSLFNSSHSILITSRGSVGGSYVILLALDK